MPLSAERWKIMYCKNCNAEFENDMNICPECGEINDFQEDTDKNFNPELSRKNKLDEIKERRELKRKREKKKRVVSVIILVAAIIASAGGVLMWLNASFSDEVVVEEHIQTAVPVDSYTQKPTEFPTIMPSEEVNAIPAVTLDPNATAEPAIDGVTPSPSAAPIRIGGGAIATAKPQSTVRPQSTANVQTAERTQRTATSQPSTKNTARPASTKKPVTTKPAATAKPVATAKPAATAKPVVTQKPQTSAPVMMGAAIQNKYVELNEAYAMKNEPVDKMSFKMGNEIYYANVNKGTTTGQINGRYKNITAHATSELFNGKPVYEITSMEDVKPVTSAVAVSSSADYVLSNSASEYVTEAQLRALSKSELSIARNEIYARHGRKFKTSSLQEYFESKSWYRVNSGYNYSDDSANLTQVEKANIQKILKAEAAK